jgi:hypothetical protein
MPPLPPETIGIREGAFAQSPFYETLAGLTTTGGAGTRGCDQARRERRYRRGQRQERARGDVAAGHPRSERIAA